MKRRKHVLKFAALAVYACFVLSLGTTVLAAEASASDIGPTSATSDTAQQSSSLAEDAPSESVPANSTPLSEAPSSGGEPSESGSVPAPSDGSEAQSDVSTPQSGSASEEAPKIMAAPMAAPITVDLATQAPYVIPGTSTDNYIFTGSYTGDATAITVEQGYDGTITLKDVNISVNAVASGSTTVANDYYAALLIEGSGTSATMPVRTKVRLQLEGANTLTSGRRRAGVEVSAGAQVNICASPADANGSILAQCGTDRAEYYSFGAGIGAGYEDASGDVYGGHVVIESGNVTGVAGYHGAGIGGSGFSGSPKYDGHVIIYGGNVTSKGGEHGAGIGGGCANSSAYAGKGVVLVLPPAQITSTTDGARRPLVGNMKNTVYVGDPAAPEVKVRTEENTPNIDIYMDMSQVDGVLQSLTDTGIPAGTVDPARILLGNTGSAALAALRMQLNTTNPVRFYTDAVATNGLPFSAQNAVITGDTNVVLTGGGAPPASVSSASQPASSVAPVVPSSQAASSSAKPAAVKTTTPSTGDAMGLALPLAMGLTGLFGVGAIALVKRREKQNKQQ